MGEVELPYWLKTLPQAPEYHPTEAEFADPVAYILKIEEEAKQYGICKIVPPFTKASKKVVVNNLNRSLSLSTEALASTVNGACAPMSRSMGGVILGAELAKPKGLCLDPSCTDSSNKSKFATRRQQLGWNPKRARGQSHSQNHKLVWQSGESYSLEQFEQKAKMFSRTRLGTGKDVPPLTVESLFWRAAAEKPISIEYANDIPGSAFADPARLRKRKRGPEEPEPVNLESIFVGCHGEEKSQEDETGEELDPSDGGKSRNGASETGGDNVGGAGSKLANSAWNMRSVARSQGSLLRFMPEEVPGVTSPMVYIGMLFSWFAWHVEDHELHSLNYLHMGASKTWYAVPGDAAPALEEAIRVHGYGGHLDPRAAFSLLGEKTTVMSPEVLVAAGVPCCRLVQNAGEYVVTFPRAYHLGFSHGFNCGEAANFATPGWLEVAKDAAARRAAMNYLPMLSHQQLLYLLTMSLPPRMPASAPSEPRSSRLKVKKKSVGEEIVKSMFLQDAVHNNGLLRILFDKGVSRCLLAKDAVHRTPTKAMSDGSKHRSLLPPLDDLERALISELSSQASEASPFPCPVACRAEETVHNHCQSLSPSCTPDPSEGNDAVFGGLSMGNFGEIKLSSQSTDPSATDMKTAIAEAPQELDGNPIPSKSHKETTSLAIDWGTLPCAACGILCYATMAVVEPSESAAMTFKPIYAAAGLGHRAFEAHEAGRMAKYIPTFPYPRSSPGQNVSDDLYISPSQNTHADGRMKHDIQPGMLVEWPNPNLRQPVPGDVVPTKYGLSAAHVYPFHQMTTQPLEGVEGSKTTFPTTHYNSKSRHLGLHTLQTANMCLETEMKAGRVTALVNIEQTPSQKNYTTDCNMTEPALRCQEELGVHLGVAVDCAANLVPATLGAARLRSGNLDNYAAYSDWKDSHPQSESLAPLARYQSTESKNISSAFEHPLECPIQPRHDVKTSFVGIDGSTDAAEISSHKKHEQGVPSLQLLASTYDESSDLEDEDMCHAPEGCDVLPEDKNSVDGAPEGGEVLAKPHSAVGDLLTDVVGLSADVPWLSLVPPTEPTDLPPLPPMTPLFSLLSLLEGPKSLKKVFISGGFSFIEDSTAGLASLGSSVTEERCGKQSSEVTSVDGDPNNQTSDMQCGDNGKVIDMQQLYQRINSQALIVDSDDDEQLMIDFGLRRPGATCQQESPDLEEPKNDGTERAPGPQQLEAKKHPQVGKNLHVTSNVPSYSSFALDNASCPLPNNLDTSAETPSKESDASHTAAKPIKAASVCNLLEDLPVGCRTSTTSFQDVVAGTQWKDQIPETVQHMSYERRPPASEACQSSRPRVLCLEHAVEAQERLRSVGGANIVIVCHSDFNDYEVRAKQLTPEFEVEHSWRHLPFTEGTNDEIRMVSTAVDVDDESRRVNDWVMQMGLFVHHRFKERESESSDDADENPSEDFRAGPFSRVNQGKPSRNRLMAGRLGLSRKPEGPRRSHAGSDAQITLRYSRRLPKMSKKKKCTIAGKWCGKVWRVNQVHPFLGGCRTVDPSLQLGMPSTSLYALSMMADCDGGRPRRGISSSKIEASPARHLIPVKNADDQQNIAGRNRGRKRKAQEQGVGFEQENVNEGPRKIAAIPKSCPKNALAVCRTGAEGVDCSSSPKRRLLAESRDVSECLDGTDNGGEEGFIAGGCEGQLMIRVSPSFANQSDADYALLCSKSGITSPCGTQMLAPVPLSTRNPSEAEEMINVLNGKRQPIGNDCGALDNPLPAVTLVGEDECCGSIDLMKTVASASMPLPSDLALVTGVNALEFQLAPSALSLKSIQTETGRIGEDGDDWHKTSSLSNVYSALPLIGRAVKCKNESNNSLVAKSSPIDGSRICGSGSAESYVWRDVPLVAASSFHLTAPRTRDSTSQLPLPLPSSIHSQLYIPYVTVSTKDAVSDHALVPQTSISELYSLSSKTFGSREQGGGNLQGQSVGQALEGGAAEADPDSCPKASSNSSNGTPRLFNVLEANGKQDPQQKPVYLRDEVFSSMEAVVPSVLDRVVGKYLGPNEEDCHGRSCETPNLPQGMCEQQVRESGGLQPSLQDIKNVVLPDGGEKFTTEVAEGFDHMGALHKHAGRSTFNDSSDQAHLLDSHRRNFHLYDSKESVELTPVLSISPSLIGEGALVGSGELGFAEAMGQGSALEHPSENIKNVVLPDGGEKFTTEVAEGFDHMGALHKHAGRSTFNDSSDQAHLLDSHRRNFHLYDSKESVELTPVLSISPSLIGEGALVGSGELGFAEAMGQGSALEHPSENGLPLRTSSRGRSAVKARGKRPKHVGWTNYKPTLSGTPGDASENNWTLKPHSPFSAPVIFTLQPKECVEARFEVEDCERVLEIPDQSTRRTCPASSSELNQVAAEEDGSQAEISEPEKVAVKAKKKAKPKKKRVPVGKQGTDDGDFHCDIDGCRMSFTTDSDLQIHKRNRCTFKGCGKRFFMHKYLLQHRRVHLDERPLKCPWKGCKQAFKWAWARTEHIRVHTGERPYSCPDCDQTFRFVSDFSRHKRNTGHTKS